MRFCQCDERYPNCKNCARLGLDCSGPHQGPVFLDMLTAARLPPVCISVGQIAPTDGLDNSGPRHAENPYRLQAACNSILYTQPSVARVYDDFLLSEFVRQMCSKRNVPQDSQRRSWVLSVPVLFRSTASPCLSSAIRSVMLLLHSSGQRSKPLEIAAYEWYADSLQSLHAQLRDNAGCVQSQLQNLETMCTTAFCAIFEMFASDSAHGWLTHMGAAIDLLNRAGPWTCQTGLLHQFFRSLRAVDVMYLSCVSSPVLTNCQALTSIAMAKPATFGSEEWLTVPYMQHRKSQFSTIVDILLALPECVILLQRSRLADQWIQQDSTDPVSPIFIRDRAMSLLSRLDNWWAQFTTKTSARQTKGSDSDLVDSMLGVTVPLRPDRTADPSGRLRYGSTQIAATIGYYDVAKLVLCSILLKNDSWTMDGQQSIYRQLARNHGESILSVAAFQEATRPVGGDFMRTSFPLRFVASLCPSRRSRSKALEALKRWNLYYSSLKGVCGLKLPGFLSID